MLICKRFLIVAFFSLIFITKVKAGLLDYTIHVTANTNNFNMARNQAIQKNRELALEQVIDKFVNFNNFQVVNKLLDVDTAYFFENQMRISNETIEGNLYNVDITYYFNQDKIIAFLNKNNIPYTLQLSNKVLFIPIFNNTLDAKSIWLQSWSAIANNGDYLTEVLLSADISQLDINKILSNDKQYLNKLMTQYAADDVVIMYLEDVTPKDNTNSANSNTNSANAIPPNTTTVVSNIYNLKLVSVKNNNEEAYKELNSIYTATSFAVGFAEMYAKEKAITSIEDKNSAIFKVTFNNFVDWVTIYNDLQKVEQIENIDISEIGAHYVIVKLKFHGSIDDIVNQVKVRNIIIDQANLSIKCSGFCY